MTTSETTPGAEAAAGIQYALRTAHGFARALTMIAERPETRVDAEPVFILARSIIFALDDAEDLAKKLAGAAGVERSAA